MWLVLYYAAWSGVITAASVGIVDLIEYTIFNPAVFYVHNFPDVVPYLPQGKFAAFWSGWMASWFIYVPERLLLSLAGLYVPAFVHIWFPFLCLLFMICDRLTIQHIKKDIFYYHRFFYIFGVSVELGWVAASIAAWLFK